MNKTLKAILEELKHDLDYTEFNNYYLNNVDQKNTLEYLITNKLIMLIPLNTLIGIIVINEKLLKDMDLYSCLVEYILTLLELYLKINYCNNNKLNSIDNIDINIDLVYKVFNYLTLADILITLDTPSSKKLINKGKNTLKHKHYLSMFTCVEVVTTSYILNNTKDSYKDILN